MKGNLGQYMTVLGFCALAFYGVMLGCGYLGLEAMPQFVVTAVIFLTAGRMLKKVRLGSAEEEEEKVAGTLRREPDWAWLTAFMNWTAALLIIALMAIMLMKPTELSLLDAFKFSPAQGSFFAEAVP
jgi:type IV secretory pathway VirB2 component (pilin)